MNEKMKISYMSIIMILTLQFSLPLFCSKSLACLDPFLLALPYHPTCHHISSSTRFIITVDDDRNTRSKSNINQGKKIAGMKIFLHR